MSSTVNASVNAGTIKRAIGPWKCSVCLIKNDEDRNLCEACETPRPGYEAPSGPKFLFSTAPTDPASCPFLKNIGIPAGAASGPTAPSSTGFGFGFGNSVTSTTSAVLPSFGLTGSTSTTNMTSATTTSSGGVNSSGASTSESPPPDSEMGASPQSATSSASGSEPPTAMVPKWYKPDYSHQLRASTFTADTAAYDIYTWGTGDCDQLPFTDEELDDVNAIPVPRQIPTLAVSRVACGALHTVALLTNGRMVSWGCNDDKALGRSGDERSPGTIESVEGVTAISCGDNHSACITDSGSCYVWGVYKDSGGFIGFPLYSPNQTEGGERCSCGVPTEVEGLPGKCTSLVSGENHTAVLCKSSTNADKGLRLCLWGDSEFGQLGFTPIEGVDEGVGHRKYLCLFPKEHETLSFAAGEQIEALYSGGAATFLRTTAASTQRGRRRSPGSKTAVKSGAQQYPRYYGCGRNYNGEIGLGFAGADSVAEGSDVGSEAKITTFRELEALRGKDVTKLAGGQFFTAALVTPGEVYTWGMGEFACLGRAYKSKFVTTPTRVPGLDAIAEEVGEITDIGIAAGTGFITTSTGLLFSWGEGISMQLGTGEEEFDPALQLQSVNPQFLAGRPVHYASGGSQHSVALVCKPQMREPVLKRRRVPSPSSSSAEVTPVYSATSETSSRPPAKKRARVAPDDTKGRKRIRHTTSPADSTSDGVAQQPEASTSDASSEAPPPSKRDVDTRAKKPVAKAKSKSRVKSTPNVAGEVSQENLTGGKLKTKETTAAKDKKPTSAASELESPENSAASPKVRSSRIRGRSVAAGKSVAAEKSTAPSTRKRGGGSKEPKLEAATEAPKLKVRRVGRSPTPTKEPPATSKNAARNTSLLRRSSLSPVAPKMAPRTRKPATAKSAINEVQESVDATKPVKRAGRKAAAKKPTQPMAGGKTPAAENLPKKAKSVKRTKPEKPAKPEAADPKPLTRAQRLEARKANAS